MLIFSGGNRTSRVRFRFESDGSDQFDFLKKIRSDRIESIYMCFFRSLINFNWIKDHLILDRIGSDQIRIDLN
jgi:hypothetical protein